MHHDDETPIDRADRTLDLATLDPAEFDLFLAGYHAGRASGLEDGYTEGYEACDAKISRLQRAAVAATRRQDPFPCLSEGEGQP